MLDAIFQAWQINVIVWGALVIAQWVIHTRYISVIWNKEGYNSASVWRTTTDPKHVRTIERAASWVSVSGEVAGTVAESHLFWTLVGSA